MQHHLHWILISPIISVRGDEMKYIISPYHLENYYYCAVSRSMNQFTIHDQKVYYIPHKQKILLLQLMNSTDFNLTIT